MHPLYYWAAPILAGQAIQAGAPAYHLELWVASAMLGVTFPVIIIISDYFAFWPIIRKRNWFQLADVFQIRKN